MAQKRKSIFSLPPNDTVRSRDTKVKKSVAHQVTNRSDVFAEHELTSSLSCFPTLSHEIIDNLCYLDSHPSGVGSGIIQAARDFNQALRSERACVSARGQCNGMTENRHATAAKCEDTHTLPPLPPIHDTALEKSTFTHPAMDKNIESTYDRLEVLGDAYIELIATRLIWTKYQGASSGHISRIREVLVKNETLAEYAASYGLDSRATVPQDHLTQPKRWTKTKADIFEAYVAAVILSDATNGYSTAERWLTSLWMPKLVDLKVQPHGLHAKEDLAKRIMGRQVRLKYIDEKPPMEHGKGAQTFFIGVYLNGWGWDNMHLGSGQGSSKAVAGDKAARNALENKQLIEKIMHVKRQCIAQQP